MRGLTRKAAVTVLALGCLAGLLGIFGLSGPVGPGRAATGGGGESRSAHGGTRPGMKLTAIHHEPVYFVGTTKRTQPFYVTVLNVEGSRGDVAHRVTVDFDFTALRDKVVVHPENRCKLRDRILHCNIRTLPAGKHDRLPLFRLTTAQGVGTEFSAPFTMRVNSLDAGGFTAETLVRTGIPDLRVQNRPEKKPLPPFVGKPPAFRPAFTNAGTGASPEGAVLALRMASAGNRVALPDTFTNCFYSPDRTQAYCEFPMPIEAGGTYTTSASFEPHNDTRQVDGRYVYEVWPLGRLARSFQDIGRAGKVRADPDLPLPPHMPGYRTRFARGTGNELTLIRTDSETARDRHSGEVRFATDNSSLPQDLSVAEATVRGRVGENLRFPLSLPQVSHGTPTWQSFKIRLPQGVSVAAPPDYGMYGSETGWCGNPGDVEVTCTLEYGYYSTEFHVRIDREVPGATGEISVETPPGDPYPENNRAVVRVQITPAAPASPR
ncbi:hypothetical protein LG634_29120 [Streptomyces bambusae]|uniref:hypothetical protein n=1 Tax=Streptomyces bambusae TaxID=1550616 RepID=UPI001CFE00BB|nr:hypothetical protein [Streptomyces bambusae]MCB5168868.1 hypothetical protein [Streptomyces bambusae]